MNKILQFVRKHVANNFVLFIIACAYALTSLTICTVSFFSISHSAGVSNLPNDISKEKVQALFEKYGEIVDIDFFGEDKYDLQSVYTLTNTNNDNYVHNKLRRT